MTSEEKKKILYLDMDGVLVDFESGKQKLDEETYKKYEKHFDEVPGMFGIMDPMPGALDAFNELVKHFDVFILTTAPRRNDTSASDKVRWVKKYLGEPAYKRLIITHRKDLNKGDFLVDDRTRNGASEFEGEHILFGSEEFPDWKIVLEYLLERK